MADMEKNRYPSEPLWVRDALNRERGWVLSVVYDGNTDSSEVGIYDRDFLETGPVCRLGLPSVITPDFQGT